MVVQAQWTTLVLLPSRAKARSFDLNVLLPSPSSPHSNSYSGRLFWSPKLRRRERESLVCAHSARPLRFSPLFCGQRCSWGCSLLSSSVVALWFSVFYYYYLASLSSSSPLFYLCPRQHVHSLYFLSVFSASVIKISG